MAISYDQREYLDRKECARYLSELGINIAPKTLANLAANSNAGNGPPFVRTRWSRIYYNRADVKRWADKQTERIA
jgi:hypothetical protein